MNIRIKSYQMDGKLIREFVAKTKNIALKLNWENRFYTATNPCQLQFKCYF